MIAIPVVILASGWLGTRAGAATMAACVPNPFIPHGATTGDGCTTSPIGPGVFRVPAAGELGLRSQVIRGR